MGAVLSPNQTENTTARALTIGGFSAGSQSGPATGFPMPIYLKAVGPRVAFSSEFQKAALLLPRAGPTSLAANEPTSGERPDGDGFKEHSCAPQSFSKRSVRRRSGFRVRRCLSGWLLESRRRNRVEVGSLSGKTFGCRQRRLQRRCSDHLSARSGRRACRLVGMRHFH